MNYWAESWGALGNILCFSFQGIQAQTVANFYLAFEAQLAIIPVINKVEKRPITGYLQLFIAKLWCLP